MDFIREIHEWDSLASFTGNPECDLGYGVAEEQHNLTNAFECSFTVPHFLRIQPEMYTGAVQKVTKIHPFGAELPHVHRLMD
jgi:hypothetical protein